MRFLSIVFLLIVTVTAQDNLHKEAVVADLHADALYRYIKTGHSFEKATGRGHVDLARLEQGGVDVQFFAVWPDPRKDDPQMFKQSAAIIDTFYAILKRNPDKLELALGVKDIERIMANGKLAACLGLEGGTAIESDLDKLDYMYERGVRYLGLTWNDSPDWASSAIDETNPYWKGHHGLSDFGRQVIRRMNELGMMVDVSHCGEQTFYDALEVSKKPLIASHSSVYEICPHPRNLKDAQIKALAEKGGVVFINFYAGYLVAGFDKIYQAARKRATAIQDSLKAAGSDSTFDRNAYIHSKIDALYPSYKVVVDHIDYVVDLVGDDHVGLGSDYDGISLAPTGLENVAKMPVITKELQRRGYSEDSIKKILGGNLIRVFRENEEN